MSVNISPVSQYVEVDGDPRQTKLDPLGAFTRVPASDPGIDWDTGWGLRSECPAGGMWCCGDGLTGGGNVDGTSLKEDPTGPTPIQFIPFLGYQVSGCTGGTSRLFAERASAASNSNEWLTANMNGWLTQALEIGVCDNPGLVDLEDVTDPGGPGYINPTISWLMRNRRELGMFDRPIIHIPDWLAPVICDTSLLREVADIAFGPGYGTNPLVAPDPGQAWIYITGKVEYSIGSRRSASVTDDDLTLSRQNRSWELAEELGIYRFDPCAGFKALIAIT